MDDDTGLLSSSSSVASVTCSSKKSHKSMSCGTKQRLNSGVYIRRSSSPSLISSSSRNDDHHRTSTHNDSVSSSNSSVFIEEKPYHKFEPSKLMKSLNHEHNNTNRTSYSDDYDTDFASMCQLPKLKNKQAEVGFFKLLHECQMWIETISNKKFAYPNDFRKSLENGVLLCELLNVLKQGSVRRINKHSTPIAGIDNLNVFLRACQDNFHLNQADLFDITDLEDLNRRRGESGTNCYGEIESSESSEHIANSTEKLNCNPNLNDYFVDEEQKRRLKKVINTINWLSRKAIEHGIQIAYHFDTNNPAKDSLKSNHSHQSHHSKNLTSSYNSVSSSTSSSSSSYCSSFSNSSLNQYSTSSSLSSSSSLSVIVPTNPVLLPPQTPTSKTSNQAVSGNNLIKKRFSSGTQHSFKNLDETDSRQPDENNTNKSLLANNNHTYTMSYIYKQQQSNLNGGKLANSIVNRRSACLQIDPSSSSNSSSSSSSASSEYNIAQNSLNRKDSIETIDSMSNSSNNSSSVTKLSSPGNANSSQIPQKNKTNYLADSQDDLQLIDSTMSPISSSNSAAVSPRLPLSTSSSSNNISQSAHNTSANSNNTTIPTRFVERRISSNIVEQKFNVNYSEAGQRLARKAEEQLKNAEKSKEIKKQLVQNSTNSFTNPNSTGNDTQKPSLLAAALAYNKKDKQPPKPKSSGSGGGSVNDDWQNSVDDWKKRRREKKNLPPPRNSLSGDFIFNEDENTARTERKRINRFENSQYYISPPRIDNELTDESNEKHTTQQIEELVNSPNKSPVSENNNKTSTTAAPKAATIELSGISPKEEKPNASTKTSENPAAPSANNDDSNLNDSTTNDDDDSHISPEFKYAYIEKFIDIERPYDYNSRGFGFLLNSGLLNKSSGALRKLKDSAIDEIVTQNYPQVIVVEHDTLADKAGLKKGDLVTKINETPTSNLNNEQLRKIMRQRLQLNSIQLSSLTLEKLDDSSSSLPVPAQTQEPKASNETQQPTTTTTVTNNLYNLKLNKPASTVSSSKLHQVEYQQIVAPKPYKKSVSSAILPSAVSTLQDQQLEPQQRAISQQILPIDEVKVLAEAKMSHNDDTDHDNDEVDDELLDSLKLPPPVPATAPPPLPNHKNSTEQSKSDQGNVIKKALFEKIKSVENWKAEQELLMKRKYEEGQKKIEISLKLDLEKVKEEENQRREQERLKLEKERLRLEELELKQKELDLVNQSHLKSLGQSGKANDEQSNDSNGSEFVRTQDLNALIEKIYTEESNENDLLTDYNHESTRSDYAEAQTITNSSSFQSSSIKSFKSTSNSVVMTKTSPIVAAALSFEEDEDFDLVSPLSSSPDEKIYEQGNVSIKHDIIKKVHESMDNLKSELLKKGMPQQAKEVKNIHDNLETVEKKQVEAGNLKLEQEKINKEKEKIEIEKERLRHEAEQLKIERELILLASTSKKASTAIAASSGNISSPTSSTSSTSNEHSDADFDINHDQQTHIDQYKLLNQFTGTKSIPIVFPRSVSPQKRYSSETPNYQNVSSHYQQKQSSQPQHWLIEEAERQRMSKQMNQRSLSTEQQHLQRMRRSVPNLIAETSTQQLSTSYIPQTQHLQKHSSSNNFNNYQNSGYINPSLSSSAISRIYQKQKKPSPSPNHVRHSHKYQQAPAQRTAQPYQSITNPYISKPPSNPRQMSSSQSDLKNLIKSQQYQPKVSSNNQYNQKLSTSTSSLSPSGNCPIISLNQKCSCCSQMLGQGSAMFIEKLGLAFHLKCFRCSVCNIPLGNGKEGTDVRVSVTNRLHCNNCFSNDLGVRLSAV